MKFLKKTVSKYGNSKVINISELRIDEEVYILDKEMLEFVRGIKIK